LAKTISLSSSGLSAVRHAVFLVAINTSAPTSTKTDERCDEARVEQRGLEDNRASAGLAAVRQLQDPGATAGRFPKDQLTSTK
jgi:hypothetical protein